MPGPLILVAVLLLFPVLVGLSTAVLAGLLGHILDRDAALRHEGSELIDFNT